MRRAEDLDALREEHRAPLSAAPVYSTDALFKGAREIEIVHKGEIYRLRITRQGKLILNK